MYMFFCCCLYFNFIFHPERYNDRLPTADSPASPGALVTSNVRYAVCMCSYGYFGEVMRLSEGMRALGPLRYDVAGVWAFLKGAQWELDIRAQT